MSKALSLSGDIASFFELRRLFAEYSPDIIHLHSSKAGVLGRLAAGRRRPRTLYTVHGFDTILKSHRVFLPLERALQYSCGAVVAVSEYDRANLEVHGISHNLRLVRNGVRDWRGVEPGDARAADPMRAARSAGKGVVLCVARLAAPKRFDLFCEVALALEPEGVAFFWIGNERAIDATKVPRNVTILGSLPDAGAYHNLADLSVLFSDYEGLPMSVLEALSCGTPVVASNVGGVAEALDGSGGKAVANEAAEAVGAIRSYLPGGGRREGALVAARRRYEERFSLGAMAAGYMLVYSALNGD